MKKSPTIINFFEKTKNCCQTFLSSCCDYDSRKKNSQPSSILVHRYPPEPKPEFTNPFFKISSKVTITSGNLPFKEASVSLK